MKQKILILTVASCLVLFSQISPSHARSGLSIGPLGMGNFFFTDGGPDLKIGPGTGIMFDYRFNQRWSIETDVLFSFLDGEGDLRGDNNMYLLGVPVTQLKFYPLSSESSVDPYISAGLGIFVLTEGSRNNNTGGVGLSGNVGAGVDIYFGSHLSFGLATRFYPIALIQGNNQSAALINLGVIGSLAWHFN